MGRVAFWGVWCTDTSKQIRVESWLYFADTCEQTLRSEASTCNSAKSVERESFSAPNGSYGCLIEIQSQKGLDNAQK